MDDYSNFGNYSEYQKHREWVNAQKKKKSGGGKKCLTALVIALLPLAAYAQTTQCQTFSDGVVVCYPVGGGSIYGR